MRTWTALFDLDGTLVDSVPDLAAALNRLLASHDEPPFTCAEVAAMIGDGAAALVAKAFAGRAMPPSPAALPAFLADYGAHAVDQTCAYPGIPEALAVLRDAGWRMAVCTNKPENAARTVLDGLALSPFFAAVGGGDSFATRKPDPAHLFATLAAAGGEPARALMVGDHHNDVAAANAAGIPCVFAAWGYGPREAGATAAEIAERGADLPAIMAELAG